MSLSAAKSRVMFAREYLGSPSSGEIESLLQAAEGFLAEVLDEQKQPVLAEIAEIRAALEASPTPDETRLTSAAQGKLRQVRDYIEQGINRDDILTTLGVAEGYLVEVRDKYKEGPLVEIGQLREQLGAPPAPEPARRQANNGAPADDDLWEADSRSIRQARTLLDYARESAGNPGRPEEAELRVEQVLNLLASVPDAVAVKGEMLAEVDEVRAIAADSENAENIAAVRRTLDSERRYRPDRRAYDQDSGGPLRQHDRPDRGVAQRGVRPAAHHRAARWSEGGRAARLSFPQASSQQGAANRPGGAARERAP